jgi:hypothetical protein
MVTPGGRSLRAERPGAAHPRRRRQAERSHRTTRQNDARTTRQRAQIGTYVLVALDAQIAGYGRDLSCFNVAVMCALLECGVAPERAICATLTLETRPAQRPRTASSPNLPKPRGWAPASRHQGSNRKFRKNWDVRP